MVVVLTFYQWVGRTGGGIWTEGPLAGREPPGGWEADPTMGIPLEGAAGPPPPVREMPPPADVYGDWEDPDSTSDPVWPDITQLLPLEVVRLCPLPTCLYFVKCMRCISMRMDSAAMASGVHRQARDVFGEDHSDGTHGFIPIEDTLVLVCG